MIVIAFGHEKNVGKTLAGKLLCSDLRLNLKGASIQQHYFATKLKRQCHELYAWAGLKDEDYYEDHYDEKNIVLPALGLSPRDIWIGYGTHVARAVYPDTWVDWFFNNVNCDVAIIRDLRFPSEADRIHHYSGYCFKLERPSVPHTSDDADDPLLGYTNWDGVIVNDGTIADFNKKIVQLSERLRLHLAPKFSKQENVNAVDPRIK